MTATIVESIEHLDFRPVLPCQSTTCEAGNPPASFVLKLACGKGLDHGGVYCSDCERRWYAIARDLDALPVPIPHRACGSFDPVLMHGKMEPLT